MRRACFAAAGPDPAGAAARLAGIFSPQACTDRSGFAAGLVLLAAAAGAVWMLLDPLADAAWIPDEALVWIARGLGLLSGLWTLALVALSARRAHDLGLSGAWGLLAAVPPFNSIFLVLGLVLPGSAAARDAWSPGRTLRAR